MRPVATTPAVGATSSRLTGALWASAEFTRAGMLEAAIWSVSEDVGKKTPILAVTTIAIAAKHTRCLNERRGGAAESFCRKLDRHSHSQDAINFGFRLILNQFMGNGRRSKCPTTTSSFT